MAKEGLNARQEAFVNAYIKGMSGKDAAIAAGYAPKNAEITASKLLRISKVKDAVAELQQAAKETAIVDAAFVMKGLVELVKVNAATYQKEGFSGPVFRSDGSPVMRCVDPHAAHNALKTLGQFIGLGKEKEEKDTTIATLAETLRDLISNGK